jgi:hypothetical protein
VKAQDNSAFLFKMSGGHMPRLGRCWIIQDDEKFLSDGGWKHPQHRLPALDVNLHELLYRFLVLRINVLDKAAENLTALAGHQGQARLQAQQETHQFRQCVQPLAKVSLLRLQQLRKFVRLVL